VPLTTRELHHLMTEVSYLLPSCAHCVSAWPQLITNLLMYSSLYFFILSLSQTKYYYLAFTSRLKTASLSLTKIQFNSFITIHTYLRVRRPEHISSHEKDKRQTILIALVHYFITDSKTSSKQCQN
jgi:hypothetical protein